MQEEITLCEQINDSEVEKTIIFCDVESITQSEFEAVGQKDIKPQYKFVVWSFEYSNQTEIEYNGQRLPLAKDAFRETKENPLPEPPYLVYIVPQVVGRGSDERILLHEIHAALELYTDKVVDGSLEKEIEEKVLFDVDYTKYQDTIESEDMVQTAYEFTIYEKVKKKG